MKWIEVELKEICQQSMSETTIMAKSPWNTAHSNKVMSSPEKGKHSEVRFYSHVKKNVKEKGFHYSWREFDNNKE